MLLDCLKDFTWYNEPANVRFVEGGMLVETEPETDFWQSAGHNFHKDNGHFFYTRKQGNFSLTVKWHFEAPVASDQCGIMLRLNNLNWAKAGFLSTDLRMPQLGSVVTINGSSDWAAWSLEQLPQDLWFRLLRRGSDFILLASTDGEVFRQLRMFSLPDTPAEIKAGAYACSPQPRGFECVLEDIS